MEKTVSEAIAYRRSVRIYKDEPINPKLVKKCLENAFLAPNSSNLQLWEFYHVVNKNTLGQMAKACLHQNAAETAQQLVVIVTRKDLWRKRANANLDALTKFYSKGKQSNRKEKFKRKTRSYYGKLIPMLYTEFVGILGFIRYVIVQVMGLFKPVYRQVRLSDMRIVAHKSAALAAQNFMLSMSAIGYDTCPMEGSDTLRLKNILNLPGDSEINMVIGCGIRDEKGVYGPRFRVPFEEVYKKI